MFLPFSMRCNFLLKGMHDIPLHKRNCTVGFENVTGRFGRRGSVLCPTVRSQSFAKPVPRTVNVTSASQFLLPALRWESRAKEELSISLSPGRLVSGKMVSS